MTEESAAMARLSERLDAFSRTLHRLEAKLDVIETRMDDEAKAEARQLKTALIFLGSLLLSVLGYIWLFRNEIP